MSNDGLAEQAALSKSEFRGILRNDIAMKDGDIRKFLSAIAILKTEGKK